MSMKAQAGSGPAQRKEGQARALALLEKDLNEAGKFLDYCVQFAVEPGPQSWDWRLKAMDTAARMIRARSAAAALLLQNARESTHRVVVEHRGHPPKKSENNLPADGGK